MTLGLNKELENEISEILQVHNQETRRPKCAKSELHKKKEAKSDWLEVGLGNRGVNL